MSSLMMRGNTKKEQWEHANCSLFIHLIQNAHSELKLVKGRNGK
jgi:hypothetical protein